MAIRAARRFACAWRQCRAGMSTEAEARPRPVSTFRSTAPNESAPLESLVPMKEGEQFRWGGKVYTGVVLGKTGRLRLHYQEKVKELRKEYQKEEEERRIKMKRLKMVDAQKIQQIRDQKCIIRWQRKELKRLKAQENRNDLRVILENQRLTRAAKHEKQMAMHQKARDKKLEQLREESCTWIEEKDLEQRIHEAMVEPIRLIGTGNPFESFETFTSTPRPTKVQEDPLLRDDDDELLNAFGRKPPKISGQDILAAASKTTPKLPF